MRLVLLCRVIDQAAERVVARAAEVTLVPVVPGRTGSSRVSVA